MSAWPPAESLCHSVSRFPLASFSRDGSKFTMKETDGLNLKSGPASIAMKGWPASSKERTSQSPVGVGTPRKVERRVIREPGNAET